jgi:hypothetical protein
MDSIDIVELVMAIGQRFGVELPNAISPDALTAGDLWRAVVQHSTGVVPAGRPPVADPIWREVALFVAIHTEVPVDDVSWDTPLFRR